jgi:hypothetical protein
MEIHEALEIVRKLANGVHPETGAILDSSSPFQHPQTVRALNRAVAALEFQQERERARHSLPANAGKPWSSAEDTQIATNCGVGSISRKLPEVMAERSDQSWRG